MGALNNRDLRSRSRRGRKFYRRHILNIPRIEFPDTTKRLSEKAIFQGGLMGILLEV